MQILLKDIQLFGFHGVTPLENRCGTLFSVDMVITLKNNMPITVLEETVDYMRVYHILKTEFKKTTMLLEVLADTVLLQVLKRFSPQIDEAEITIFKINAAVEGFQGRLGVKSVLRSSVLTNTHNNPAQ